MVRLVAEAADVDGDVALARAELHVPEHAQLAKGFMQAGIVRGIEFEHLMALLAIHAGAHFNPDLTIGLRVLRFLLDGERRGQRHEQERFQHGRCARPFCGPKAGS
ncbi:MAG: hypothetical protein ACK4L7_12250, partial [Flavobacteriales bacterium]